MTKNRRELELIDKTVDDDRVSMTNEDIDRELHLTDLNIKNEELEGNKQDRKERKSYANKIFWFLAIFVGIMLLIVVLCGFKLLTLNDPVIITLISTTAANIIGIFIYVVKYLFRTNDQTNKSKKE